MYKHYDVQLLITEDYGREVHETRASVKFYGLHSVTTAALDDHPELEVDAKEEARKALHYAIYGEVAKALVDLNHLARDYAAAGRALGTATWHHADYGLMMKMFEDAEKAYSDAYTALLTKLENHP